MSEFIAKHNQKLYNNYNILEEHVPGLKEQISLTEYRKMMTIV